MEWTDDALILGAAKHGESSVIADLLTRNHGRHKGLVRGGTSSKMRGVLQPGNQVRAIWRARLADHLGTWTLELSAAHAAALLHQPDRLLALSSLCAMAAVALPEREAHPALFDGALPVVDLLAHDQVPLLDAAAALIRWEAGLLGALGYGLDLSACAVTGEVQNLTFVSPRSGRAVSTAGAGDYASRLLALPSFLNGGRTSPLVEDVLAGFALTGHFLDRHVLVPHRLRLPPARDRFVASLTATSTTSATTYGRE